LGEARDWLGGSPGQAPTWCGPKQLEHLWAKRHEEEGATQQPRFHDLQIMWEDEAPCGAVDSSDSSRPGRTEAPAVWKLNNWTFMADQSVKFIAAACSLKAQSYANQTSGELVMCVENQKLVLQQIPPLLREVGQQNEAVH